MKKILILIIASAFFYGCPLLPDNEIRENCKGLNYDFTIPVNIDPKDSLINTNDTISITTRFTSVMWDDKHQEQLFFDSINFIMRGTLFRLDTVLSKNDTFDLNNYFDIIIDSIYNFETNRSAFAFNFLFKNNNYSLSLKIIPKHKGIYIFKIVSLLTIYSNRYKKEIITSKQSNCSTNDWRLLFKSNNGNTHKELLKQSYDEYYKTWYYDNWSRFEKIEGAYLFKVSE